MAASLIPVSLEKLQAGDEASNAVVDQGKGRDTCPLCGHRLENPGLEALGKHFESCPNTLTRERTNPPKEAEQVR